MANVPQVTQQVAEVVRSADNPSLRVTQMAVEVVRRADAPQVRVSGSFVDVVRGIPPAQNIRVSQIIAEVAREEPISAGELSQIVIEVGRPQPPVPRPGLPSWMVFDKDHSIDIRMVSGNPPISSADDLSVLNGANVGLLGQEVIQWVTATDLGSNVYRLSRLLRGRLGTELFMNSHSIGDAFVILEEGSVRRVVQQTKDLNVQRFFKAVGKGMPAFSANVTPVFNTGQSQKPWKAAYIRATRDGPGTITATWLRRSRISIEWADFTDVPLGEFDERYEIDILDGFGAIVRTIETTTSTFVYLDTEQVTDFGSVQDPVAIVIYQLNTIVGRGHPANAII